MQRVSTQDQNGYNTRIDWLHWACPINILASTVKNLLTGLTWRFAASF